MKSKKQAIVIGYSIDSCIKARELALQGIYVIHMRSGRLGYPFDDIFEHISYEDIIRLAAMGVNYNYKKLNNSTYVHIPYEELKMTNSRNGLLSFPLNKNTFENAEEKEQVYTIFKQLSVFMQSMEQSTNGLNAYRNFFPKWLFDSVLRHIGVNKWGGIRQTKYTIPAVMRELNLSYLDQNTTGVWYKPDGGFETLCEEILNLPNIKKDVLPVDKIKKAIMTNTRNISVFVMDNRIDQIMNHTYGTFDRVEWNTESIITDQYIETMDIDNGFVLTPLKPYWAIACNGLQSVKISSTHISDKSYLKQSMLIPTVHNLKVYNDYKKAIPLYSGKQMNLDFTFNTMVQ